MRLLKNTALHELIFGILMAVLAVISPYAPRHFSEGFFDCVLFLLIFNLAYFLADHSSPVRGRLALAYLGVNITAAAVLISQSGGRESVFWVALMHPVLSAAVAAEGSALWPVVVLSSLAMGSMYLSPRPDLYELMELGVKCATLAFAGGVTARASRGEARLREEVDGQRLRLQTLALHMVEDQGPLPLRHDLRDNIETRLRRLEAPLALIDASLRVAELEAPEAKADFRRIEACQRLIRGLTQDLFDILHRDEYWFEQVSFEELYRKTLTDLRTTLAARDVRFKESFQANLPRVPVSRRHFEQFLYSLLERSLVDCRPGQEVRVAVHTALDGNEPYLQARFEHPGLSDPALVPFLQRIIERHGGWLKFSYETGGVAYTLGLPYRRGALLTPPES